MSDQSTSFSIDMEVRDYEVDMEGIVNNAVYLNYLEHARHQFLKSVGIDFAELTRQGMYPVVVRSEVDYKTSLKSGDRFRVLVGLERVSRLKVAFVQEIYRLPAETPNDSVAPAESGKLADAGAPESDRSNLAIQARIIAALISDAGRPLDPEQMHPRFAELLS